MNSTQPQNSQPSLRDLPSPQQRIIRAWCMYDWANSAYATSGVAAIIPIYFVFLFKESLGEETTLLGLSLHRQLRLEPRHSRLRSSCCINLTHAWHPLRPVAHQKGPFYGYSP